MGRTFWIGVEGTTIADCRDLLEEIRPAGVILFDRNIRDPDQVRLLCREIRDSGEGGTFVAVDCEGGRVNRLAALTGPLPSFRELGAAGDPEIMTRYGAALGHCLAALGITANFAPVVDLDFGHEGNGIGDRSLGAEAVAVIPLARAFLAGLGRAGVLGCLKHFPGLGRTIRDTHKLPALTQTAGKDLEEDLSPFVRLGPEAPFVMVGHAAFPTLTGDGTPASCSPRVVTDLLKGRMGYAGCVVCDDLGMGALKELDTPPPVAALQAGCHLLLACHGAPLIRQRFREVVSRGDRDPAFRRQVLAAAEQVDAALRARPRASAAPAWEAAQARLAAVVEEVAARREKPTEARLRA